MRIHVNVETKTLVEQIDRRVGAGSRSAFIAALIRRALDDERRWDEIEASLSSVPVRGHAWTKTPRSGYEPDDALIGGAQTEPTVRGI